MNSVATTTINIQLGTAFWVLLGVLIIGGFLYWQLGTEKMHKVLSQELERIGDS